MSGRLRRIWGRIRYGGIDYLLTAFASYLPDCLLDYHHVLLFIQERRQGSYPFRHADRIVLFDQNDIEKLAPMIGRPQEKLQENFDRGDICCGVVDKDRLLSYKWARTSPTRLGAESMYTLLDPGRDGFYMHSDFTVPEARRQGMSLACTESLFRHFAPAGRTQMYAAVEPCNAASHELHRRHGSKVVGETFYVCLLGLRWVYRRSWPTQVERFERIHGRRSGSQTHTDTKQTGKG
jgi:hypothetical protein